MEIKTSYKVKQQELAKSLKDYSHFVNKASIPMILIDIEGFIHFLNNHVENLFEYDKFKILAMDFFSIFSKDDKNTLKKKLIQLSDTNSYMEFEAKINLPFTSEKTLTFNISRFQKNVFLVQIDDRVESNRKVEKKINSLNNVIQFYEHLIDTSSDAYIGVNREGDIILFNAGAEQVLGYKSKEIRNIKIWELYPSFEEAKKTSIELYKNNGNIKNYSTVLKSKFNNIIKLKLNAFLIYDDKNNIIGSIGVFKVN
jgi:two-component system NtrC family sensor kinase